MLAQVFLGLAVLGVALPLAAFLPWLAQHGLNVPLFLQELFGNRVSAFFAWDVLVSAVIVLVATFALPGTTGRQRAAVTAGTLLIGVSCGLPLLLWCWLRGGALR